MTRQSLALLALQEFIRLRHDCEPNGDRTTTTWDYENQPTLYRLPDGSRATMTYNADLRCVKKEA